MAAWVERICLRDRQVLPRYHQQDRRCHRRPGAPAGGYRDVAPPGAYARIECWRSRKHWLTIVVPIALDTQAETLRGRASRELMIRYLRVLSGYAAERTGRHCIVRPLTIASVLQVDVRTVKRCRAVARDLGLEVVIRQGRMLTDAERKAAQASGSTQRGLSTEVALTVPRGIPRHLWTATPSRGPQVNKKTSPENSLTFAASSESNDTASPRPTNRSSCAGRVRRLASDLVQIVPWLDTEQPGRLRPALNRFASSEPAWTAHELSWTLADVVLRQGHDPAGLTAEAIRTRPAVMLAALLRQLDEVADHPSVAEQWAREDTPCGHPECDGHGWLLPAPPAADLAEVAHRATATATATSVPCPRCSPTVRARLDVDDEPDF